MADVGATQVVALEFKAGSAPDESDARHLIWLRDQLGRDFRTGAVFHSGPAIYELSERIYVILLCAIRSLCGVMSGPDVTGASPSVGGSSFRAPKIVNDRSGPTT